MRATQSTLFLFALSLPVVQLFLFGLINPPKTLKDCECNANFNATIFNGKIVCVQENVSASLFKRTYRNCKTNWTGVSELYANQSSEQAGIRNWAVIPSDMKTGNYSPLVLGPETQQISLENLRPAWYSKLTPVNFGNSHTLLFPIGGNPLPDLTIGTKLDSIEKCLCEEPATAVEYGNSQTFACSKTKLGVNHLKMFYKCGKNIDI